MKILEKNIEKNRFSKKFIFYFFQSCPCKQRLYLKNINKLFNKKFHTEQHVPKTFSKLILFKNFKNLLNNYSLKHVPFKPQSMGLKLTQASKINEVQKYFQALE